MSLGARIFLGYFLIVGLGVYFLMNSFMNELRPGVRQSMEDALVDTANLLAEVVQEDVKRGSLRDSAFEKQMQGFLKRDIHARIWGYTKNRTLFHVYITDAKGIVLYDSEGGKVVGQDYSKWNDVYLTLRGQYGARSTRIDPEDAESSIMYVAAPVKDGDRIIGAVTVAKPNVSVRPFIELGRRNILRDGAILVVLSLATGMVFSWWFSRSIHRLSVYAQKASRGERVALPELGSQELQELGATVEHMREELEGRKYVEHYAQTLTHELKSPLAALRGAAELLEEDMPQADRERFVQNIQGETARMQDIIDRLLDQAVVEHRQVLQDVAPIDIAAMINDLLTAKQALIAQKRIQIEKRLAPSSGLQGEHFLLRQALHNLLDNALAFTPPGGKILIEGTLEEERYVLCFTDTGTGIPDYAKERLFERFYSLPRPDTRRKSSGLGLPFVKEVAELHGGNIAIANAEGSGTKAILTLPVDR